MTLRDRLAAVHARIDAACHAARRDPGTVTLVAISKNHPAAAVRAACTLGHRVFGENRVQELVAKAASLDDVRPTWHMVGSVQTNKVKDLLAVRGLELVHSVDRRKLADALQARWSALAPPPARLACLIEIAASGEPSKHGTAPLDAAPLLLHVLRSCPGLDVQGLMAMGPRVGDPTPVFATVARLRDDLRWATGLPLPTLSLGMTDDLEAAIAAGSTMVRVGTGVFGARP